MSSGKKVGIGQLGEAINEILQQYSDEVVKALPEATKKAAKEGTKALKSAAAGAVGGTSYKGSFKNKQTEGTSNKTEYTIYSTQYQLAHLLEHGHTIKNQYGVYGVTRARPHWITAEETANKVLEEEIRKKVEESG